MPWYAIDSVSDAFEESKSLLFPFGVKRWVVLAIMTFFVGGSTSMPSFNQSFDVPQQGGGQLPEFPFSLELVLLVALVVVVVFLVFLVIGSIMEFVFVDALRSHDVRIRGPFGERTGPGIRLLGFRIFLFVLGLLVVGLVLAPIYAGIGLGIPVALIALVLLVPIGIVAGLALAIVQDFTTAFVVPLICERGGGIIETWRRDLWPSVRSEWQQYLLYIVLKWGLGLAVGFVVGIGLTIVFLPVLVLLGAGFFAGGGVVTTPLLVVAGVFVVVAFVLAQVFVQMPITVFIRYYSLRVLDKVELEWSLYPAADGDASV